MGRRRVASNQDGNILSMLEPVPIEIIQMKGNILTLNFIDFYYKIALLISMLDANLLVYIPGYKETPLMNYTDALPLSINYISFTSYDNIPARWFYDCQFDGFATELEEEVKSLTAHQKLVKNIITKAENASFPPDLKTVKFSFDIGSIRYQQNQGFLQTRLNIILVSQ